MGKRGVFQKEHNPHVNMKGHVHFQWAIIPGANGHILIGQVLRINKHAQSDNCTPTAKNVLHKTNL